MISLWYSMLFPITLELSRDERTSADGMSGTDSSWYPTFVEESISKPRSLRPAMFLLTAALETPSSSAIFCPETSPSPALRSLTISAAVLFMTLLWNPWTMEKELRIVNREWWQVYITILGAVGLHIFKNTFASLEGDYMKRENVFPLSGSLRNANGLPGQKWADFRNLLIQSLSVILTGSGRKPGTGFLFR